MEECRRRRIVVPAPRRLESLCSDVRFRARREIERRLTEDDAKPLIYFNRGGICWDPKVKGLTVMVNSIYNGWRMEDVWLDK